MEVVAFQNVIAGATLLQLFQVMLQVAMSWLSSHCNPPHSLQQILQLPWCQIWNPNLYSEVFVHLSTHERGQEQHLVRTEEG